jgi:hypothetical protein
MLVIDREALGLGNSNGYTASDPPLAKTALLCHQPLVNEQPNPADKFDGSSADGPLTSSLCILAAEARQWKATSAVLTECPF